MESFIFPDRNSAAGELSLEVKPAAIALDLVSKFLSFIDFFRPEENRHFYV